MITHRFAGSAEQFGEFVRTLAASHLAAVEDPSGDPASLLVIHRTAARQALVLQLPDYWFSDAASKKALGQLVLTPLAASGADYVALVMMTWVCGSDTPAGRELERLRAAGEPTPRFDELGLDGVQENVIAWVATRDDSFAWVAQVKRSVIARPAVGSWELAVNAETRWLEALHAGWGIHA